MERKPVIHVVGSDCKPGEDQKANTWYENTHLPMLFKFKGLKDAARYKIVNEGSQYPTYLNIYTFESRDAYKAYQASPELAAAMQEKKETWGESGGPQVKWRVQYELVKAWKK